MRKQWVGKNVDLTLLIMHIGMFLKNKGYKTKKNWVLNACIISLIPDHNQDEHPYPAVTVLGNPADFVIEFTATEKARSSVKLNYATTLFGGGFFLRQNLKLLRTFEKLENEFWAYVEDSVLKFTNSARKTEFRSLG